MNNHYEVVLRTPHVMHSEYKSQTSLDNRLAFLCLVLHVMIDTCVYKTELTSDSTKWIVWRHLPGGVLGQVSDRDAPHRPSTRNATRVKKGGRNYTFCPILMKNRGRNMTFSSFLLKYRGQNTTFSSFLLKYRGRNSTNFPETWKRGVETEEHI